MRQRREVVVRKLCVLSQQIFTLVLKTSMGGMDKGTSRSNLMW